MHLSRRALLAAGFAAFSSAPVSPAIAQGASIGAVRVDVGPAIAKGGGEQARQMGAILDAALRRAFAGSLQPGGASLTVYVNSVILNTLGGSGDGGRDGGFGGNNDYLDTDAVLTGAGGREISRFHVLSPIPGDIGVLWSQARDRVRLESLAVHNAGWVKRYATGF